MSEVQKVLKRNNVAEEMAGANGEKILRKKHESTRREMVDVPGSGFSGELFSLL